MLVSREEQNCLVITYKEIKACIETAFGCAPHTPTSLPSVLMRAGRELSRAR